MTHFWTQLPGQRREEKILLKQRGMMAVMREEMVETFKHLKVGMAPGISEIYAEKIPA